MELVRTEICMESVACNFCGSENYKIYWQQTDKRFPGNKEVFTLVKCRSCALIYLNPRPKREHIGRFYPSLFYDRFIEQPSDNRVCSRLKSLINFHHLRDVLALREKVSVASRYNLPKPMTVLDVGCGSGDFLKRMASRGWIGEGIDISQDMAYQLKCHGIECRVGDFNEQNYDRELFDIVTMWASLEHLYDPFGAIKAAYRTLKAGGHLVILVPNARSLEERLFRSIDPNPIDIPRHLYHFSEPVLKKMLKAGGFYRVDTKHFTLNVAGRLTRIIDQKVAVTRNGLLSKLVALTSSNISTLIGDCFSAVCSVLKRSPGMILTAEKEGNG